jgi:hypothetical protein
MGYIDIECIAHLTVYWEICGSTIMPEQLHDMSPVVTISRSLCLWQLSWSTWWAHFRPIDGANERRGRFFIVFSNSVKHALAFN